MEFPRTETSMDIVFVSAEVAPWSKTGGLGDVVGSLPVALARRGHRVMVVAPRQAMVCCVQQYMLARTAEDGLHLPTPLSR